MNKDLLEKLTQSSEKLLDFIEKTGETSVDFAKEQVPLVIQEVLSWGLYSNLLYGTVSLIFATVCLVVMSKSFPKLKEWSKDYEGRSYGRTIITHDPWYLLMIIPGGLFLLTFLIGISYYCVVLKIWCAPRLYLIETLQTLIR